MRKKAVGTVVRRRGCLAVACAAAMGAAVPETGRAQEEDLAPLPYAEAVVSGLVFDNFFQAADGAPRTSVTALGMDARLGVRFRGKAPVRLYGRFRRTLYDGFDASTLAGGGVAVEGERHGLDLAAGFERDRPTRDVGDAVEPADVLSLRGEYGYRFSRDWEVKALGDLQRVDYEASAELDGEAVAGGGAVRWRGLGYEFSPEVGYLFGARGAEDPGEDYSERTAYLQLRSVPIPALYLSLRYRYRDRGYSVADPLARNFGREDERHQLVLLAEVELARHVALFGYHAFEDARSTRESRTFDTRLFMVGLKYGS